MLLKRIALKNFLTYGEAPGGGPVELVFADGEPLWVLCGANGTGKTALFDALTYALYGEHRGGKQKADLLIRHNANGFEVAVDFEFNGVDYRIRRTRPRRGRTTQHLQKRVGGEWKGIRDDDTAGAVTADDIEEWVTETLGLSFDAFTNSVLLQQGKADKLFTASRDDRIEVLKGIIGFEQFEALSGRVSATAKEQGRVADGLLARRDALQDVSDADVALAEEAVRGADAVRAAAQGELARANERVSHARQWEKAERERKELDEKITAADEREKQGRKIREKKKALDALAPAVPVLEKLFKLRDRVAALEVDSKRASEAAAEKAAELEAARKAAETAHEKARQHKADAERHAAKAKELAGHIEQDHKFLAEADAIAELDKKLSASKADPAALLADAEQEERAAGTAAQEAGEEKTRAETLLAQAEAQQVRFAGVKIGVECPHCRQSVDEAHAAKVRADLADEVGRLQGVRDSAKGAAAAASRRLAAASSERQRLQTQKRDYDALVTKRDAKRDSLKALGTTANAAELREQLAAKKSEQEVAECARADEAQRAGDAKAEADRHEKDRQRLGAEVRSAEDAAGQSATALATARGQEQTTLTQLSDEWKGRLPSIDSEKLKGYAADLNRLIAENVAAKFEELEQDKTRRAEWEARRRVVGTEIDDIPQPDRIPEVRAREQQAKAETDAKAKADAHTAAANSHKELTDRRTQREALTAQHRDAAERHRLLARLDKLLGDTGLQLELVRDAEEQIVAFANETLQHLSDGDLSLEEDTTADSTKTFDLRARRAGGEPIGVAFLSGSQRFRVAVSIALAVGRFASGRARPLESVIIDEGFGSLDPQGLQAMAGELKRLQQTKSLRRVILVSHQPDFTDQFPVGYALTPEESGTTATAFRR